MFSSEILFAKSGSSFYNGVATQSVRFDDGSSPELTKTWGANETDGNHFTVSFWVKRCLISSGTHTILQCDTAGGQSTQIIFNSSDELRFNVAHSGTGQRRLATNQVFRDTTNWYHILCAYDNENSTAAQRTRIYVNGVEVTSFSIDERSSIGGSEVHGIMDNGATNTIGFRDHSGTSKNFLDGYLCDFYCIDGQTLTPSDFTETKEGALIPKKYSGSYGNNGFRLEFKQTGTGTASTTTIGADTSGNTNHFTSASLVASDSNIPDSPENNFPTINSLFKHSNMTFSEGNLKYTTSTNQRGVMGNFSIPIGTGQKYYFEYIHTSWGHSAGDDAWVGLNIDTVDIETNRGGNNTAYSYGANSGAKVIAGTESSYGSSGWTTNDVIGIAVDRENNTINFAKNNTYQGTFAIPSTGNLFAWAGSGGGSSSASGTFNFGQDSSFAGVLTAQNNSDGNNNGDFYYSPPSGFLALCTANLSEPTLGPNSDDQADDHFDIVTYTGNSGTNNITFNMSPDMVWIALRSSYGGGYGKHMWDTSRGDDKYLYSSGNNTEATGTDYVGFQTNGFQIGVSWAGINLNSEPYVTWGWKANGGTTTTNDASATGVGTIDSVYQANTTAGFSIVTWTGTASAGTIAHGLGKKPACMWVKNRTTNHGWTVFHHKFTETDPETDYMYLNDTMAKDDSSVIWNDTAPTSTVFSVGTHVTVNESSANQIGYIWAEIDGYSKFGSYEGNANTDGVYVHLGFRPRLLICKNLDTAGSWIMFDSERHPDNIIDIHTMANNYAGEGTDDDIDFLSNGFKARRSSTSFNSAHTFIYMAWAEMPEKYSLAR